MSTPIFWASPRDLGVRAQDVEVLGVTWICSKDVFLVQDAEALRRVGGQSLLDRRLSEASPRVEPPLVRLTQNPQTGASAARALWVPQDSAGSSER